MVFSCELCGKQTEIKKKVMIEKTVLNVCMSCAKRGKPIESYGDNNRNLKSGQSAKTIGRGVHQPSSASATAKPYTPLTKTRSTLPFTPRAKPQGAKYRLHSPKVINMVDEVILNPEFHKIIREARTKKGLSHDQLGQKINEKVTLLRKIETGTIKPDEPLAKKLERFLGITLYINPNEETA
jgi:putative transcription factor